MLFPHLLCCSLRSHLPVVYLSMLLMMASGSELGSGSHGIRKRTREPRNLPFNRVLADARQLRVTVGNQAERAIS
jgi:hypothetical protein